MVAVSRVNPNFPIPGIDQSSRGFRDNFSTIKSELEAIQGKSVVLTGDVTGSALIDSGGSDIVLTCSVATGNIVAGGGNLSIQYNYQGITSGHPNFVYDPNQGYVGIGTSQPLVLLDIYGDATVRSNLIVTNNNVGFGEMEFSAAYQAVRINSNSGGNNYPILLELDGQIVANISGYGMAIGYNVGFAQCALDIYTDTPDMAHLYTSSNNTDNGVRLITDQSNASMGLMLDHIYAAKMGGMRIDHNGNISIHAGESTGSQLSNSSAKITVLPQGRVGIGVVSPANALHVAGGVRTTDYSDIDPVTTPIAATLVAIPIDTWNNTVYRTARYVVQITDSITGDIDIREVLLAHANGAAVMTTVGSMASSGVLGTLSSSISGTTVTLALATSINGISVKLDKRYITL